MTAKKYKGRLFSFQPKYPPREEVSVKEQVKFYYKFTEYIALAAVESLLFHLAQSISPTTAHVMRPLSPLSHLCEIREGE